MAARMVRRSLVFLAGVGVTAVPAIGPFVAMLALLPRRIEFQRADAWWGVCAVLLAGPFALTGHPSAAVLTAAQVLAVWLISRSAGQLHHNFRRSKLSADLGAGLLAGLAITFVLGLRHLGEFRFDVAKTVFDAVTWKTNPAVFGHALVVLAGLTSIVLHSPKARALALIIGAVGAVISGAREAIWAWLAIAAGLALFERPAARGARATKWVVVGLMALLASGIPTWLGLGRLGFLTDYVAGATETNLFRGTEVAMGDWWIRLGVEFEGHRAELDGQERTAYTVRKTSTDPWARLQQAVTLTPDATYTLSALLAADPDTRPGFDGYGRLADQQRAANLAVTLEGGALKATTTGPLNVLDAGVATLPDGWSLVHITFHYQGADALTWYVGVVPDRSNRVGSATTFTELQLVEAPDLLPYRPGAALRGVTDLQNSRFPVWRDALEAIGAKPLLGWGPGGLPKAMQALHPDDFGLRSVAAHAHNAFLAVWVERGFVGVLGLAGLFLLLGTRAIQQRDRSSTTVLLGILLLNFFDTTILSGVIIYPAAAVFGWMAAGNTSPAAAETGVWSATGVRLGLALADMAAGVMALSIGMLVAAQFDPGMSLAVGWRIPLLYCTLAWPAIALAAGLYPGYGLPSHEKLGRNVKVAVAGAVTVGFLSLLLRPVFGLTPAVLWVTLPAVAVIAPLFRSIMEAVLRRLRLWGRPVVVLGTDAVAERVSRHLLAHPETGLHPVAVFGEQRPWNVPALPLRGSIASAWEYLRKHKVRHVIVSPRASESVPFDNVLLAGGNRLKYVQYLPNLTGLPAHSVVAAPVGAELGLQVRNQLMSPTNRAVKRTFDLLVAVLLLVPLAVPLLVIGLFIRLDSKGPALYFDRRLGRGGKVFSCIKFRTMRAGAKELLTELLTSDSELSAQYATFHKLENDPRVTRLGRVLRKFSIDELPQLVNVVRGEMSLVGPRPYLESERDLMGAEQSLIFLARPGVTGYWQTEARNDVSFEERLAMEAHYVRNWSLWWDLDILMRSPGAVLAKKGK